MKQYIIIEDGIEYKVEEHENGNRIWSLKNLKFIHRENGPAIEYLNGYKIWYKHGHIHREDGPAEICLDGTKGYYLNSIYYPDITSDEEWLLFQIIT